MSEPKFSAFLVHLIRTHVTLPALYKLSICFAAVNLRHLVPVAHISNAREAQIKRGETFVGRLVPPAPQRKNELIF
jgi:hypothetical protein